MTDRTPEELRFQRAQVAAGFGDPFAEDAECYSVVVELKPRAEYRVGDRVKIGDEIPPPIFDTIEGWPRTLEGVITATSRAAWLSMGHGPHEIHLPDGRLLARFVDGRRVGLPDPMGI